MFSRFEVRWWPGGGRGLALSAGSDLELIASRVSAGKEAYLYAGGDLNLDTCFLRAPTKSLRASPATALGRH